MPNYSSSKKPICWWKGHEWTDSPFMGTEECARCGAFDDSLTDDVDWLTFLAGVYFGLIIGGSVVAFLLVSGVT